ncbi:MAG: cysteine desulfuration protein SufE [Ponticaulis sp.]|nr:cysteine desulfuration protein SufE [Ponticaulis sp.]|tara:strand:- start:16111 stop:16542 length:432 start_codon:yes stop_codon:yes gene_type:complete
MSISAEASDIRDTFAFLDDWEARYEHIIDLGKALPALSADETIDAYKVPGCASQVWIVPDPDATDPEHLSFRAQSDAILVSGLIAVLSQLFNNQLKSEILDFDADAFFNEIGLKDALSAQRANGLRAMLGRIHTLAGARSEDK